MHCRNTRKGEIEGTNSKTIDEGKSKRKRKRNKGTTQGNDRERMCAKASRDRTNLT